MCFCRSEKASKTEKRIANIIEYLTFEVFRYTVRGLYENHQFIFTLLLALKIDLQSNKIEHNKFQILIKGKTSITVLRKNPYCSHFLHLPSGAAEERPRTIDSPIF